VKSGEHWAIIMDGVRGGLKGRIAPKGRGRTILVQNKKTHKTPQKTPHQTHPHPRPPPPCVCVVVGGGRKPKFFCLFLCLAPRRPPTPHTPPTHPPQLGFWGGGLWFVFFSYCGLVGWSVVGDPALHLRPPPHRVIFSPPGRLTLRRSNAGHGG